MYSIRVEPLSSLVPEPLTKSDLPSGTDSPTMMAAEIQVEPAYYNWHGTISAHRYEEKRCVLQMPLVMYGDQDAKSGSDDTDGNEREGEAVLDPV